VSYKGAPVAGATVSFLGDGTTQPAMAITETNGDFTLSTTSSGDGAVPGSHLVTVVKMMPSATKAATPADNSMEAAAKKARDSANPTAETKPLSMVPEKYASAATSGLQYTVKEGDANNFKIELKD
jgi:hypothetical protein